jgi:glycosyltransferase involved in cell wall biosynthesis
LKKFYIYRLIIEKQKLAHQKKIIVSVTNDLVSDNRVHKVCTTLTQMGFAVLLVGRELPTSTGLKKREYKTKRFKLFFKKGIIFYAEYNFRLFLFLLFTKFDVLLANDLDSLTANFLASKIKNKALVYDSHEYFTEVPELINRPAVQRFWEWLERKMVPNIQFAYTVCDSIANVYREKYGTPFKVVRNIPLATKNVIAKNKKTKPEKIVLYQGAVNIGRGLEQAILAMQFIEGAKLLIAGDGDIKAQLEKLVEKEKLQTRVEFTGRLPLEKLSELTQQADLGLSIEEDLGLNYRFALPNKLFDYIQAQIPVLVTNLPEMVAIVEQYGVGEITSSLEPKELAEKIEDSLFNIGKREMWKSNLKVASKELTWEKEEKIVYEMYSRFLD